jgi:hypothetical protein
LNEYHIHIPSACHNPGGPRFQTRPFSTLLITYPHYIHLHYVTITITLKKT